jgi:hypothetical protein
MNSNTVLSKVMTLLSLKNDEAIKLAYAKLADGTLLESPTFDVGETVEIVSEDGSKSPAPDGEHELELTGAEGESVLFKIFVKDGHISERENVELEEGEKKEEEMADVETVKVEKLPEAGTAKSSDEQIALEDEKKEEELIDEEVVDKDAEIVDLGKLAEKMEEAESKIEEMKERIEELTKYFEEIKEEEIKIEAEIEEEKEMESKKLDGAPIEASSKFSKTNKKNTYKIPNSHNTVLSKMYR